MRWILPGQSTELKELRKICDEYGLVLITDGAHSIGTRYDGKPTGSIADLTTFSFHPVKTVTSGEGGAVMTDNGRISQAAAAVRKARDHQGSVPHVEGAGRPLVL